MKLSAEALNTATAAGKSWRAVLADLVKARFTGLVLLTTFVGFYLGERGAVNFLQMFHALFGTALVASGVGTTCYVLGPGCYAPRMTCYGAGTSCYGFGRLAMPFGRFEIRFVPFWGTKCFNSGLGCVPVDRTTNITEGYVNFAVITL